MITVNETKIDNQIAYHVVDTDTGEFRKISYTSHKINRKGRVYIIIYDERMQINNKIFEFLNFHLSDKSESTVYKAAQALKLLFSYEAIFNKKLQNFKQKDINNLKVFLHGYDLPGNDISLKFNTRRSNSTINSYLSIYRQLLDFLGIHNAALFKRSGSFSYHNAMSETTYSSERYYSNEKTGNQSETPKYISVDEFKEIIKLVRANYTIRE